MSLSQSNIWDFVNSQSDRSSIKRIKWQNYLGMTLTEYITSLKNTYDLDAEKTFNHIIGVLQTQNFNDADLFRRVKISVYARFGEQNSLKKRMERKK